MNLNSYIENLDILHVNTEDERAYYIPFSEHSDVSNKERTESDRFQLLNGEWNFHLFENTSFVSDNLSDILDGKCEFDKIAVPSCIQLQGYDNNQYTNIRYPFPFDPPYVPFENPCACYSVDFKVKEDKTDFRKYLNFEGVDSCCFVFVNKKFVGYHQVSHCTSEYDITDFLKDGLNNLTVFVAKWCDGSYFEDQDKLRTTGIFRDVYILYRPQNFIRNFRVEATPDDSLESAEISVKTEFLKDSSEEFEIKLFSPDGNLIETKTSSTNKCAFSVKAPELWNAETPNLYTLLITAFGETIEEKVGVRKVEIKDNVFLLNGTAIKIKGVNRHDSSPVLGSAVTKNDIVNDLLLMKAHNVNAIRTSHYPNSPIFSKLCDEMGFYLIAEADIETHGQEMIYKPSKSDLCIFAEDGRYKGVILDRVKKLIFRDINRPSIIMWSLGNESGYGKNFSDAAKFIHDYDKTRFVHYENTDHTTENTNPDFSVLDVYSRMYPSTEFVKNYLDNNPQKPIVLCEYCHSMGVGPGDLEEYSELMRNYKEFMGGFIWEWCDHAVLEKSDDGKKHFLYGGDFGEFPNDSNFCMDGLVTPDRKVSTGLLEFKNVSRPIRAELVSENTVEFTNCLDFTPVGKNLKIKYVITENGKDVKNGEIKNIVIAPHGKKKVTMPTSGKFKGAAFIRFIYVKNDVELGFDQFALNDEPFNCCEDNLPSKAPTLFENMSVIKVSGKDFLYEFSKGSGLLSSAVRNGKNLLSKPMEYNIYRAPTDNDMHIKDGWHDAGFDTISSKVYETHSNVDENSVTLNFKVGILPVYRQRILDIDCIVKIDGTGKISFDMNVKKDSNFIPLPRFGVRMFLEKHFENAKYFGFGPNESYCDMHRSSYVGLFNLSKNDSYSKYLTKPQENSSHFGCQYLSVTDDKNFLNVCSKNSFSFNLSHYTQEELSKKKHDFELEESESSILCIDYKMSGIGSNSCGPTLLEKYQINENTFNFNFDLTFC